MISSKAPGTTNASASAWRACEVLPQRGELGRVGVLGQPLAQPGLVGGLLCGERLLLALPVGGADGGRALERHVLEHVGEAGDPRDLLGRADVGVGGEGEDRRHRPLDDDEGPAVGHPVHRGPGLEGGEVLGGGGRDRGRRRGGRPAPGGRPASSRPAGWRRTGAGVAIGAAGWRAAGERWLGGVGSSLAPRGGAAQRRTGTPSAARARSLPAGAGSPSIRKEWPTVALGDASPLGQGRVEW